MEFRRLGRTGLHVSRICLGTMTFGLQCSEEQSFVILDRAANAGVTFLDSADVYPVGGDLTTRGRTEEILGRWLHGRRQNFVVATKCLGAMGPNPWDRGASRRHILDAVDQSLRRLQTDWIDLYQLHGYDPETPIDEMLEALDSLVRSGKVRYIGCSNWVAFRVARAIGRSETRSLARFDCVQPRYNLLYREFERDLFPLCLEEGIGVISYNPIAGGFLSGKHDGGGPPTPGTRFTLGTAAQNYQQRYWHQRQFDSVDQLRGVAADAGVPLARLAVAWVLNQPAVTAPIVGASKPEQLDETLAAVGMPFAEDLRAQLDAITAEYRRGEPEAARG
ncbi:MAG: aldo/keto reductase [Chloroflexi bacterium]|nr:aldo/keto reductase [Chloroflexota bacterium]